MFPLCDGSICNRITTETYFKDKYDILDSKINTSSVGGKILYYRLSKNLKQIELAQLADIDICTIKRYENNQVQPSLYILNKIAHGLQIDIDLLLDDYLSFLLTYDTTIRNIRKEHKLTQQSLGDALGVHRKTVLRWEKGLIHPTKDNYQSIDDLIKKLKKKA